MWPPKESLTNIDELDNGQLYATWTKKVAGEVVGPRHVTADLGQTSEKILFCDNGG